MKETENMNVYQRLSAVMQEVAYVQKKGVNDFHDYSYAKEADFVRAIRPSMLKHGLLFLPVKQTTSVIQNEKKFLTTVEMVFRIVNVDDPTDFIEIASAGQGTDANDKGIYKAITGSKKYALALGLLVETGDDAEADSNVDRQAANEAAPVKKAYPAKRFDRSQKITGTAVAAKVVEEASVDKHANGADAPAVAAPVANKKLSSFRNGKRAVPAKGGW
jgi:hypothetical protein